MSDHTTIAGNLLMFSFFFVPYLVWRIIRMTTLVMPQAPSIRRYNRLIASLSRSADPVDWIARRTRITATRDQLARLMARWSGGELNTTADGLNQLTVLDQRFEAAGAPWELWLDAWVDMTRPDRFAAAVHIIDGASRSPLADRMFDR